jgi:hypothetical protein
MGKKKSSDRRRLKSGFAPKKRSPKGLRRTIFPRMYISPPHLGDAYCVPLFTRRGFRAAEKEGYIWAPDFWAGRDAQRPYAQEPYEEGGPGTPKFDFSVLNRSGPEATFNGGPEDWDNWFPIPYGLNIGEGESTDKENEGESTSTSDNESDESEAEVKVEPKAKSVMTGGHARDHSGAAVMKILEASTTPEVVIVVSALQLACC